MDVHPNDIWEKQRQTRLHREFCNSVWFKRGWTLQELVAPSEVVFFDSNWHDLGTKHSLVSLIHKITRIDIGHLQAASAEDIVVSPDSRLNSYSKTRHLATSSRNMGFSEPWRRATTAQKMKWAAGRHTSRLEDRAYSLLGIFDVTMPLLYGEGETAFIRLQEEIIKQHPYDHSIFCWRDESKLGHTGLFAPNPDYFGLSRDVRPASVTFREEMARYFGGPAGTPHDPIEVSLRRARLRLPLIGPITSVQLQRLRGNCLKAAYAASLVLDFSQKPLSETLRPETTGWHDLDQTGDKRMPPVYIAVLDCTFTGFPGHFVGIMLRREDGPHESYVLDHSLREICIRPDERWASYQTFSVYAHLEYKNATGGTEEGLQQPYLSHKTAIQLIYVGTEPYGLLKVLGDSSARGFVPFQNQCDLHIEAGDRNWLIFIKADSRGNLTTFALFVGRLENSDKLWTHIEFPASSNDAAYWTMPMNRMDREHDVRIPQFNSPQGSEADYRSDGIYEGLTTRDLEGTNGGVVVVRRRKARGWPGDPEDVNVVIEGVDNRPLSMADEGPQEESPVSDEDGPNEEDDACRSGASTPQSPGGASLLDLPPGFDRFSLWEGFAGFNIPHPFADDDGVPENWYSLSFREMLNHVPKRLIHQFEQQQKQKQKQQGDILVKDPDSPQKQ
ncbi:ankyrin repeat-containing domain protein [Apiospora marii]|uniref:Ankyrin repeat-containing domain protein n=1 Tax=Apiospora marii TaxID=335849 RepID=A0ABR1R1M4_9PEZI